MQQTPNFALKKIELTDSPPDITVINPNWDTIDTKLKENANAVSNVQNYGIATQAEAEAGALNNKYMTPLVTKNAIQKLAPTPANASTAQKGVVQLSNSITGSSQTVAATEKAVKDAKEAAIEVAIEGAKEWGRSYGLGDVAKVISGQNLNNLVGSGLYMGENLGNAPYGGAWFYIEHMRHNDGHAKQIAHALNPVVFSHTPTWMRLKNSGVWGAWTRVLVNDSTRPTGANLNISPYTENGTFALGGGTLNGPTTNFADWGTLVTHVSGDVIHQEVMGLTGERATRYYTSANGWRPWQYVATTTDFFIPIWSVDLGVSPTNRFDLNFLSGYKKLRFKIKNMGLNIPNGNTFYIFFNGKNATNSPEYNGYSVSRGGIGDGYISNRGDYIYNARTFSIDLEIDCTGAKPVYKARLVSNVGSIVDITGVFNAVGSIETITLMIPNTVGTNPTFNSGTVELWGAN